MILVKIPCLKDVLVHLPKIIMSLNQLIWKISLKIMSSLAIIVELAAYTAAGIFNEGSHSLLFFPKFIIWVNLGHNAHTYTEKTDAARISLSDRREAQSTHEGRLLRRQQQIVFLESETSAEKLLYRPRIYDSI